MSEPEPLFDLSPAAASLAALVAGVPDDRLGDPTPCDGWTVATLLAHLDQAADGFTRVAHGGDIAGGDPMPELRDGWRERIPAALAELGRAWREPSAWGGSARVGGLEMDRVSLAATALDELVVHGWDLARATGAPFEPRTEDVSVCAGFVRAFAGPDGTPGLFGPEREPLPGATEFERVLAATGRAV